MICYSWAYSITLTQLSTLLLVAHGCFVLHAVCSACSFVVNGNFILGKIGHLYSLLKSATEISHHHQPPVHLLPGEIFRSVSHLVAHQAVCIYTPIAKRHSYTSLRFIFAHDTRIYLILCRIVPGKKKSVTQKLFLLFAATMARSGFCPYHGLCCEDTPTKHIGIIPTPWAKTCALGLGVLVLVLLRVRNSTGTPEGTE